MFLSVATTFLPLFAVYVSSARVNQTRGSCDYLLTNHRITCGDDRMTAHGCLLRGCCWDDDAEPHCYMGNVAHEAYSTRPTDKHGRLYTVSNALDGKDPLGKSQENWAISENGKYAQMNVYFDTFYNISAVTLYGEEDTLHDLDIRIYNPPGSVVSCAKISGTGYGDMVHRECESSLVGNSIEIKRNLYPKYDPLKLSQIYVSGVEYKPQCEQIDQQYKLQGGNSSMNYEQCTAAGWCYDEAESPSCFLGNIAYGKSVEYSSSPKAEVSLVVDGTIETKYFALGKKAWLSIDLRRSYSIKRVIIKFSRTNGGSGILYVTRDGNFTSNDQCTSDVTTSKSLNVLECATPKHGRFLTLYCGTNSWYYCPVYEIVALGTPVEPVMFGVSTLKKWGQVDKDNSRAIVIPNKSAGWSTAVGTVTGWKVSTGSTEAVHLSFWRPADHGHYTYVGGTDYTPTGSGIFDITLEESQLFDIQQGDVIGIQWNNGGVIRFTRKNRCTSDDVKHLVHVNPSPTHSRSHPVYFSEMSSCGEYQIQAMIDP